MVNPTASLLRPLVLTLSAELRLIIIVAPRSCKLRVNSSDVVCSYQRLEAGQHAIISLKWETFPEIPPILPQYLVYEGLE